MLFCAVDVGSNSIKYTIAEMSRQHVKIIFANRYPIRLGAKAFGSGKITVTDINDSVRAFREISAACQEHSVQQVRAVATSALRESRNSADLVGAVHRATGIQINLIAGEEEARLVALAVKEDLPAGSGGIIVDIGGGSTEIVSTSPTGSILACQTFPLGAVRLAGEAQMPEIYTAEHVRVISERIEIVLSIRPPLLPDGNPAIIGIGGTIRTLADLARHLNSSDPTISRTNLAEIIRRLVNRPLTQVCRELPIDLPRAQILLPGALILDAIMHYFKAQIVMVSDRSLRDGILAEMASA